jgi:hypothetical protein
LMALYKGDSFGGRWFPRETGCRMAVAVPDLLQMTEGELDELFRRSEAGEIPDGEAEGTVLLRPGTELAGPAAKLIHFIAWQGKVFDRKKGELRNEILPFGVKAVRAMIYKEASWLDDRETIVLDYSKTSLAAHWIRDEIREIAPGTYLGLVYWERKKVLHFALKFPK